MLSRFAITVRRNENGFTIAELITVCAIVAILASVALPVARFGMRRQKEIELRDRLRRVTEGIDRYHEMITAPPGPNAPAQMQALGSEGYPKDLDELLEGVKLAGDKTVRFVRERDLTDPMTGERFDTRSTSDAPDASNSDNKNVFEVRSKSTALSLDGKTRYNEW